MQNQQAARDDAADRGASRGHERQSSDFPVREYVGAMAAELAQMARWDGDERLARLLDAAAEMAARPPGDDTP